MEADNQHMGQPGQPLSHLQTPVDQAEGQPTGVPQQTPERRERTKRSSEILREQREAGEIRDDRLGPVTPLTHDEEQELIEAGALDDPEDQPTVREGWSAAFGLEQSLSWAGRTSGKIDPDFEWDDETFTKMTEGVPEEHHDYILDATSMENAMERRKAMQDSLEKEQILGELGWTGLGQRVTAAMLDPVAMAAGTAAGVPFAAGAYRAGRAASSAMSAPMQRTLGGTPRRMDKLPRTAHAAATGFVSGAAAEGALVHYKPTGTPEDVLYAAAGSAALSGAMTAAFARSLDPSKRNRLKQAHSTIAKHAEDQRTLKALRDGSAKITRPDGAPVRFDPSRLSQQEFAGQATPEEAARMVAEDPLDHSAFRRLRLDLSAQMDKSKNPLVRWFGKYGVQDATGRVDDIDGQHAVNPQAVSEWQARTQDSMEVPVLRDYEKLFKGHRSKHKIGFHRAPQERANFNRRVTRSIRSDRAYQNEEPEVQQAADLFREHFDQMRQLAQNPGLFEGTVMRGPDGFQEVPRNPNYVPRIPNYSEIRRWRDSIGDEGLDEVIRGSLRAANPEWSDYIVNRVTRALRQGYLRPNFHSDLNKVRGMSGEDWDELRSILRNETDLEDGDIEGIIQVVRPGEDGESRHPRAMERTLLAEDHRVPVRTADGEEVEVSVMDFMQEDILNLTAMYDRQVTGLAAMARMGFYNDADWQDFVRRAYNDGVERGQTASELQVDQRNLDYAYRGIRGMPTEDLGNKWTHIARTARGFQFLRVMGQVGWAQLSEIGNILGQEGLSHAFRHMPTLRAFTRDAQTGRLKDPVLDEFESAFGLADDILKDFPMVRLEEHMVPADPGVHSEALRRVETTMEYGRYMQSFASGLHPINVFLQRWAGRNVAGQFDKYARRWAQGKPLPKAIDKRLKWAGLDDHDIQEIFRNIRDRSTREEGLFSDNVARFNLESWDPETADKFRGAVHRIATQMIQQNDVGNLHPWMGHTLGKMFLQFRTFAINSWAKQFLHNVHMRDIRAFQKMAMSMVSAGTAYTLQQHLRAQGRENEQEFREQMLSDEAIAKAAFERSAWASLMPAAIDTATTAPGDDDPVFGYRASGLASSLAGSPMLDFADSVMQGSGGPIHAATRSDYDWSQEDAGALMQLLPYQNVMGIEQAMNAINAGLPRRSMITPTDD